MLQCHLSGPWICLLVPLLSPRVDDSTKVRRFGWLGRAHAFIGGLSSQALVIGVGNLGSKLQKGLQTKRPSEAATYEMG